MKRLHWLKVPERIIFKILLMTYKILHGLAPSYIAELISPNDNNRQLRSSSQDLLKETTTKNAFGDRAFQHAAPKEWNKIPKFIRDCETLDDFKAKLKTELFKKSYPTSA